MLKYFIQVIQNLLSAAVLTALLSSLADKTDEGKGRRRFLFWGAGAVLAALAVAVLRRTTRLINREFLNTGILLPAILLGLFFILLLRLSGGKREGAKTGGLERISEWTSPVLAFLLLFYALPTVFLYPPEFLLPGQSVLSTDFLYKLIGYLAGLVFVALISFALFESAGGLPLSVIKITLGASLAVNLVNQASVIMQFLLARRFISLPRRLFRIMV
ncbi:MAG: DUF2318 domain-containing protein, partial [Treponema sp.]|nr:DUF2318 domain-containing protein [Treponema sp.]